MNIQVLGSGCPTCKKLYELTQAAVAQIGDGSTVEYITGDEGTNRMLALGALGSPVLVVDGRIAMTGFIPDVSKIKLKILGAQG